MQRYFNSHPPICLLNLQSVSSLSYWQSEEANSLSQKLSSMNRQFRGFLHRNLFLYRLIKRLVKELSSNSKSQRIKKPVEKLGFRYISRLISKIDWQKTKAYFLSDTGSGIFVNLEGREKQGIVKRKDEYEKTRDQLISILESIKDPQQGKGLDLRVLRKEDVYSGSFLESAPDLLVDNNSQLHISHFRC